MLKKAINKISDFFDTAYFAAIFAAIELLCYFLGLDLLIIIVISLALSFVFLFKKKLNCIFVLFLFLSSMISIKNSPSYNSDFYFKPGVYITCIVFAAIPVLIIFYKAISNIIHKRIKIDSFFVTSILLGVAFIVNGLLSKNYVALDTMFGAFMFFFFVVLLFAVLPHVSIDSKSLITLGRQVSIYILVPFIELIVFYGFKTFSYKPDISLGWGSNNTIGMLFVIAIPFIFYLIKVEDKKALKVLYITLLVSILAGIVLTFSRQSYLFTFVLVVFYLFFLLFKANGIVKKRIAIGIASFFTCLFIVALIGEASGWFDSFGITNASSLKHRFVLWQDSYDCFKNNPVFGGGFFFLGGDPVIRLNSIMPFCCHNTIFEMLGACGFVGLLIYLINRVIGLKKIFEDLNAEKMHVFMSCFLIVLMSLLDIHLFDFFGTALYIVLLAMSMSKSKTMPNDITNDIDNNKQVEGL